MINDIKFLNMTILGKNVVIKFKFLKDVDIYTEIKSLDISVLNNDNKIIKSKNIKCINKNTINATYIITDVDSFIDNIVKKGLTVFVKFGSEEKEFKIKNIRKDRIYKNFIKRVVESKKYNTFVSKVLRINNTKEKKEDSFDKKIRKDNVLRRNVLYATYYEEEQIDDKIIFYESFHGSIMGCNPYAIFEYLINDDNYRNFKHIWALNDINKAKDIYKDLDNVEFVEVNSDEYIKYLAKAKYLINNTTFPNYYIRKEGQVYLNTWHGTPMKSLGKYITGSRAQYKNVQRNLLQTTHMIMPNEFTSNIMISGHDIDGIYKGKILDSGYPRVDLTLNSNSNLIKEYLNLDLEKKVILYAPTWRGETGNVSDATDKFIEEYEYLLNNLGDTYNILIRPHNLMIKQLVDKGYSKYIVDERIDTNELLSVVDVLISDYSSIIFDFIPTKKPIFLYCYDLEDYLKKRGLIIDIKTLPVTICKDRESLLNEINKINLNLASFNKNYNCNENKYNYNDDGNATQRVVDFIFNDKGDYYTVDNNKKNILIYIGSFINNGITSSGLNLLDSIDYDKYNVVLVSKDSFDNISENNISKLNSNVKIIYRCGQTLKLKDEFKYEKYVLNNIEKEDFNKIPNEIIHIYEREYNRVFGLNTVFDSSIDFGGYARFWSLLISSSKANKKIIYQHSDMWSEHEMGRLPDGIFMFKLYNNFDNVVSVSKNTMEVNKENLSQLVDDIDNKFVYINNCINYDKILRLSSENNIINIENELYQIKTYNKTVFGKISMEIFPAIDTEKINFVTIGRISPEKDQKKLIEAFSDVVSIYKDVMLYIVGTGVLEKELIETIFKLNLQNNVILTGQLENPFEIANKCDCFVLSSNHEGQPMVLLEMLTLNKDIIATDIPGNRSILDNGYGILCENNKNSLSNSMIDYIKNKDNYNFKSFDYKNYNKKALDMFYEIV